MDKDRGSIPAEMLERGQLYNGYENGRDDNKQAKEPTMIDCKGKNVS